MFVMENQKLPKACKELAKNLEKRDEYKKLIKMEKRINEDNEAKEILVEYKQYQNMIQMTGGMDFSGSDTDFADLSKKIRNNDTVNAYLEAEKNWGDLLEKVFVETGNLLSYDFLSSLGGGCC